MKEPEIKDKPLVSDKALVREAPLITVKAINRRMLEQLYPMRGELNEEPDGPGADELAVGSLVSGSGVLIRNMSTFAVRMVWPTRYLVAIGLPCKPGFEGLRKRALERLPQIFID